VEQFNTSSPSSLTKIQPTLNPSEGLGSPPGDSLRFGPSGAAPRALAAPSDPSPERAPRSSPGVDSSTAAKATRRGTQIVSAHKRSEHLAENQMHHFIHTGIWFALFKKAFKMRNVFEHYHFKVLFLFRPFNSCNEICRIFQFNCLQANAISL